MLLHPVIGYQILFIQIHVIYKVKEKKDAVLLSKHSYRKQYIENLNKKIKQNYTIFDL